MVKLIDYTRLVVFGTLLLFVSSLAVAQTIITLQDNEGRPVKNAVVSVKSDQIIPTSSQIAVMDQVNVEFVPKVLIVQKNQLVSFPNSDDIRHSVYSFSEPKTFELKLYKGNQAEPIPFDKQGLVILGCNIHDSMIGYIYVTDQELAYKTDEKGQVKIELGSTDKVNIWHERLIQGVTNTVEYLVDPSSDEFSITLDLLPEEDNVISDYYSDHSSHSNYSNYSSIEKKY